MTRTIAGKTIEQWSTAHPILQRLMHGEEVLWLNPGVRAPEQVLPGLDIGLDDVLEASSRLERFAPYIARAYPETADNGGLIESPLRCIPRAQEGLAARLGVELPGMLALKCDHELPISGSIKARGGIHEVLKVAESLCFEAGLLTPEADYSILAEPRFREFFSTRSIAVGSTGNLGLSIGIMGACLGFRVTVHMSADARQWKKDMLREKGVRVVEHDGDYSEAVARGRAEAEADENCHFVDDENSRELFLGYAVAALRLKRQLEELEVTVDGGHPLFVYLPCGVGGGPGGIAFGLKLMFGSHVRCFFVEPTHSPAMLLGLLTGAYEAVSVRDFGLDNVTAADGLAVGRPSGFVSRRLASLIDGCCTVSDETLFRHLHLLAETEGERLEPSAVAGMQGVVFLAGEGTADAASATHLVWATGGSMVPRKEMDGYLRRARELSSE